MPQDMKSSNYNTFADNDTDDLEKFDFDIDINMENSNINQNIYGDSDEGSSIADSRADSNRALTNSNLSNNNNNSNSLQFFPYSNNKLTRSVGTLNLSLSNTNLPDIQISSITNSRTNLKNINETYNTNDEKVYRTKEQEDEPVDQRINRWSPFNDIVPSTPVMKRSVSKSHLSPFINNPETLKKWKYNNKKSSTSKLNNEIDTKSDSVKNTSLSSLSPSYADIKPNQTAFHNNGLQSKFSNENNLSLFPKKLNTPNTPVKRYPLKDNSNLNQICSPIMESTIFSPSLTNETHLTYENLSYTKSPSVNSTPNINDTNILSSISPIPPSQDILYSQERIHNISPQYNLKKFKKIKKSRESVIFHNRELTNSLQQFTEDLYGNIDNSNSNAIVNNLNQDLNDHQSFFKKFPPPIKLSSKKGNISPIRTAGNTPDNSDNEQYLSTPTRRKSILNARSRSNNDTIQRSHEEIATPSKTKRNINAKIKIKSNNDNSIHTTINPDSHLFEQFTNVHIIGSGQFSKVYQVTLPDTTKKCAVKSIIPNKHNPKRRVLQEIMLLAEMNKNTLDQEGKEYVIDFISSWKNIDTYYVLTNYYENGDLGKFLQDQIATKKSRLEDWRIWKIIVELSLALRFIHDSCHIVHLDLKPANVMITFEGNLKLADFGMATHLPLEDASFENEGDREYIAPEIISDYVYDFRADIFSLGLMIVEIAANVILPDKGNAWHKLRSGDLSDAGRLSSTEIHSESLFSATTKVDTNMTDLDYFVNADTESMRDNSHFPRIQSTLKVPSQEKKIPPWVPNFLIDGKSLDKMVKWMIDPNFEKRPTANQLLQTEECQYVEVTRKAGAVIQEDDFGPKPSFFE